MAFDTPSKIISVNHPGCHRKLIQPVFYVSQLNVKVSLNVRSAHPVNVDFLLKNISLWPLMSDFNNYPFPEQGYKNHETYFERFAIHRYGKTSFELNTI
jgi:hypothetical protein